MSVNEYFRPESHLTNRVRIAEAMVRMEQAGEGYRLPLMRAAADGKLTVVAAIHGTPVPARHMRQEKATTIVLADDHPLSSGPGVWKQIRRLLRWANAVVLHATGGQPEHYELIAGATLMMQRVLVVEMQQCHHKAWMALVRQYTPRLRVLSITPPPGDCHPRLPNREVLH